MVWVAGRSSQGLSLLKEQKPLPLINKFHLVLCLRRFSSWSQILSAAGKLQQVTGGDVSVQHCPGSGVLQTQLEPGLSLAFTQGCVPEVLW